MIAAINNHQSNINVKINPFDDDDNDDNDDDNNNDYRTS